MPAGSPPAAAAPPEMLAGPGTYPPYETLERAAYPRPETLAPRVVPVSPAAPAFTPAPSFEPPPAAEPKPTPGATRPAEAAPVEAAPPVEPAPVEPAPAEPSQSPVDEPIAEAEEPTPEIAEADLAPALEQSPDAPTSAAPGSGPPVGTLPSTDPEHRLAVWQWRYDPTTLREVVDDEEALRNIRDALTDKINGYSDNPSRARLLSLRAVVSRTLGELNTALADGKLALAHAEATGELRRIAITQARLAHVHQWRGEFDEADRLFALANSSELPDRLRGSIHQHAGKSAYEQGRYIEACNHFERALELRKDEDPELMASTELALDAVFTKVVENGWGPYPRSRDDILKVHRPPTPSFDEQSGRWGYVDADGAPCIPAHFTDVQPFRDGVAWAQRPRQRAWELISETGATVIASGAGYVGVGSFSDGLAWVSRDGSGRWIAIDKSNSVTISTGFDDVRPFRRGMAAVRRGRAWGAVDGVGRVVVQFAFDGFATALADGRHIDGFSDEGLAVVELDGRKGVVDRTGRMVVEPVWSQLVIHPIAFLIADAAHLWGALDRRGRMLVEPSMAGRAAVTDELDRRLVDTRPVL